MMAAVSAALAPSPNVVLKEFVWKYGNADVEKGADNTSARPAAPKGSPQALRRQSAIIAGEIRAFRGDYRGAIETIDGIAQRLRQNPAVADVRTLKTPLNTSPTAALSGTTQSAARADSAEFELIVVFKPRV